MKNQGFFTKVRLCLCLILGIGMLGCTTLRIDSDKNRTYQIRAMVAPGIDLSPLNNLLSKGKSIEVRQDLNRNGSSGEISFVISVKNDEELQSNLSELTSAGVLIRGSCSKSISR